MNVNMNEEDEFLTCELCEAGFFKKENFHNHLNIHAREDPFICYACERKYNDKYLLIEHLRVHSDKRVSVCGTCKKGFVDKKDLNAHVRSHAEMWPYACDVYEMEFIGYRFKRSNIIRHMRIHSRDRESVCDFCTPNVYKEFGMETKHYACSKRESRFSKMRSAIMYSPIHDEENISDKEYSKNQTLIKKENISFNESSKVFNERQFSNTPNFLKARTWDCETCRKRFSRKLDLLEHQTIHTRNPFFCPICQKDFSYKRTLKRHLCDFHPKQMFSIWSVSCMKHSERFNSHSQIHIKQENISLNEDSKMYSGKQHLDILNNRKEKIFICDTCRKRFSKRSDLSQHLLTHTTRKPFFCQICKKEFSHKGTLKTHLCVFHPNDMPFICEICRKSFAGRNRIITHLRTHTEGRAIVCETCKTGSYQKCNRDSHIRKHMRIKPFRCAIYERIFSDLNNMIRHLLIHPEDKASFCNICKGI